MVLRLPSMDRRLSRPPQLLPIRSLQRVRRGDRYGSGNRHGRVNGSDCRDHSRSSIDPHWWECHSHLDINERGERDFEWRSGRRQRNPNGFAQRNDHIHIYRYQFVGGTATAQTTVTVNASSGPPAAGIVANPTSIASGSSSTLTWTTKNAVSADLNGAQVALNGSQTVSPTASTTYRITARNAAGAIDWGQVVVTVTSRPDGGITRPAFEAAIASGQAARSALVALVATFVPIASARSRRSQRADAAHRSRAAAGARARRAAARARSARWTGFHRGRRRRAAAACCSPDGDGVPVDRRGTPADDATFQSWGLWTGALWSEEHEGTNGIGTCLVEQRPLTIDRDQHFFTRNTLLSCTAVPIYDHEGGACGRARRLLLPRRPHRRAFSSLIALAAGEAAKRIEADLFRGAFAHARIVLTQAPTASAAACVAVDADDLVIGATRSAPGRTPDRARPAVAAGARGRSARWRTRARPSCWRSARGVAAGAARARTAMFRRPPRPSASAAPRCIRKLEAVRAERN